MNSSSHLCAIPYPCTLGIMYHNDTVFQFINFFTNYLFFSNNAMELASITVTCAIAAIQRVVLNATCNLLGMEAFRNVYSMDKFVLRDSIIALLIRKNFY